MPVARVVLDEFDHTVLTQSMSSIVKDLLVVTKLDPRLVTQIVYNELNTAKTNTLPSLHEPQKDLPNVASDRKVLVEIQDVYNEDALGTTAVNQREYFPFFADNEVGVQAWPIYIQTDITISFTYLTPSKSEAKRWRDDLRLRLSQMGNISHHAIEYDYIIPNTVEDLIVSVHENKNRLFPIELDRYFLDNSTPRARVVTDTAGKNGRIAIRERQVGIIGTFDLNPMPNEIERESDLNIYKATLSYKLTFDKVSAIGLQYPVVVCNQALPTRFFNHLVGGDRFDRSEYRTQETRSFSLRNMNHFAAHRQLEYRLDLRLPINIPSFDEFVKKKIHYGYAITTTFLCQVDEEDKRTVLDLNDLDRFYIPEVLFTEMKANPTRFTSPYRSIIYLGIEQEGRYHNHDILSIDSEGIVRSSEDLSLLKPTRVLFNVLLDLSLLRDDYIFGLYDNPELGVFLLKEHATQWRNHPNLTNKIPFHNTFNFYVKMITHLRDEGNFDLLTELFTNTREIYRALFDEIIKFMKSNTPATLNDLITREVFPKEWLPKRSGYVNFRANLTDGIPKPLMTTYAIALRQEDS